MKLFVMTILVLLCSCSHAEMVFMRESSVDGFPTKHIFLKRNDGREIQLTKGIDAHLYPDISADGSQVVFVEGKIDESGADLTLAAINVKTLKKQQWKIEGMKGMLLHPKFSKNGERLYFSVPTSTLGGKNSIYYLVSPPKNLSDAEVLTLKAEALKENVEAYFPRPSADGSFVVYQRNNGKIREIILYDAVEKTEIVIDQGMSPNLSFDEQKISYTSKKNGSWDIFEYDRITKVIVRKTLDEQFDEMAPSYNPLGEMFFASNKSGNFNLYKLAGAEMIRVTDNSDSDDYAPQFSGEAQFKQDLLPAFMEPLRSSFGTLNHEGNIYMCGGHQGPEHTYPKESFTNNFNVYDQQTKTWKALAPRLSKAHGFQLAGYGNYIYAFGGFTYSEDHKPNWKSLDVIERYDISKNEWTVVGRLPRARSSNIAVTIDHKVYLVGGWDSTPKTKNDYEGTFHSKIDIFDLKNETVTTATFDMPSPLRRAFTGIEHEGQILMVGGLGVGASHFELISNVTAINPQNGSIVELPKLPFATFAPAAEKIGNELFVFGGMFKISDMNYEYVSHIYGLNFQKADWRHTGRYLKESKGFSQVFKIDEKTIGILGGHKYSEGEDKPVNTFENFKIQGL